MQGRALLERIDTNLIRSRLIRSIANPAAQRHHDRLHDLVLVLHNDVAAGVVTTDVLLHCVGRPVRLASHLIRVDRDISCGSLLRAKTT